MPADARLAGVHNDDNWTDRGGFMLRTDLSLMAMLAFLLGAGSLRAEGPTVTEIPGPPVLLLSGFELAPLGYSTEEFFVSGTASSYTLAGAPTPDGHWQATPAATAPYVTRIVVVRPTDPINSTARSLSNG